MHTTIAPPPSTTSSVSLWYLPPQPLSFMRPASMIQRSNGRGTVNRESRVESKTGLRGISNGRSAVGHAVLSSYESDMHAHSLLISPHDALVLISLLNDAACIHPVSAETLPDALVRHFPRCVSPHSIMPYSRWSRRAPCDHFSLFFRFTCACRCIILVILVNHLIELMGNKGSFCPWHSSRTIFFLLNTPRTLSAFSTRIKDFLFTS